MKPTAAEVLKLAQPENPPKFEELSERKKQFYGRLAELKLLQDDFESTQNFFKERIAKIKEDSSCEFNSYTVNEAIKAYIKVNPERCFKKTPILQPVDQD